MSDWNRIAPFSTHDILLPKIIVSRCATGANTARCDDGNLIIEKQGEGSDGFDDTTFHGVVPAGRGIGWQGPTASGALKRCIQIAAAVNIVCFFLFHFIGSPVLAWVGMTSAALYDFAYVQLQEGHGRLAMMLISTEMMCRVALGTIMIGWDSGFHYHLLIFMRAIFMTASVRQAAKAGLALWVVYIGFDFAMHSFTPLTVLDDGALLIVRFFNIGIVFSMLAYLSFFHFRASTDTEARLRRLAATDPLTGLLNRRHLLEMADYEIKRGMRDQAPLSFILADIDHFKSINDCHGHEAGDRVLVAIASALRQAVREKDSVARWGGEEFLIMLLVTTLGDAAALAEHIRQAVQGLQTPVGGRKVTASITAGVSMLDRTETPGCAINRADKALYRGKATGRNRVVA